MADEGEGEEQPVAEQPTGPPPNMLHVKIEAARGLPTESATVVKFRYSLLAGEEAEEAAVAAAAMINASSSGVKSDSSNGLSE